VYAHTDTTEARQVVAARELLGPEFTSYLEGWHPIKREALPAIRELATELGACLEEEIRERVERLERLKH
jgi:hypothetical protein